MKNKKLILAVVGMSASGKSEVINYLKNKNFPDVYFGQPTFDELKKRGLKINEKNERLIREEIRKKMGMGAYAILNLPKIKKVLAKNNICLVESLYSWDEYLILKKEFGDALKILAIYASPKIRYHRLAKRAYRGLKIKDAVSRDYAQIEKLDFAGPITMADATIINQGTMQNLYQKVDQALNKIIKS